jgi:hypothetical protein
MSVSAQLSYSRLPALLWLGGLLVGVVVLTAYSVNRGLYAALMVLPLIGVLALPWHLRLSFLVVTTCYQSALIVPFMPGPLYMWLGGCLAAWSGVALALVFRQTPADFGDCIRRNWLVFAGLAVYCLNLIITLKLRGFGLNALGAGGGVMGGRVPVEQLLCSILPLAFICVRTNEKELSFLYRVQLVLACTYVVSEWVINWAPGQAMYLFYVLAPSSDMASFAMTEFLLFARYQSFKLAAPALLFLLLVSVRPERFRSVAVVYLFPLCATLVALSLLSGHREAVVLPVMVVGLYFWTVRFFNFNAFLILGIFALGGYAALFFVLDDLPLAMQRALSFLPGINIDSLVATNARETVALRWELTKFGWSQVPEYALLGRGFTILGTPAPHEIQSLIAMELWRGHFYNGFIGLLVHTGVLGTLSALTIYLGGMLLSFRLIRMIRRTGGANSLFDRVTLIVASYCIAKPIYFLLVNGNSKVALQEVVPVIAFLLACERILFKRAQSDQPSAVGLTK